MQQPRAPAPHLDSPPCPLDKPCFLPLTVAHSGLHNWINLPAPFLPVTLSDTPFLLPSAPRPPLYSYGACPKHAAFRDGQRLAREVTKPSGTHRPYLSCQSGSSLRARAWHLPFFLSCLGTWHRGEHTAETPQSSALVTKKLRIRNSAEFQSREARNST